MTFFYNYDKMPDYNELCIDMKSFYASVEAVDHDLDPLTSLVAVVGNLNYHNSVVLAASPRMKAEFNIRTGSRLSAIPPRKDIQLFNARMSRYQDVSLSIIRILLRYVPQNALQVYSIDEYFLNLSLTDRRFSSALEAAQHIRRTIYEETQLTCSIGIGSNKLMSKFVLDAYAKKAPTGIVECRYKDVQRMLWPLPVQEMWGIGPNIQRRLNRMRIFTVKDLALTPLSALRGEFGVVLGEEYHQHAHGIDLSPVIVDPRLQERKGFSSGRTLHRTYSKSEAKTVIYELTDQLTQKLRQSRLAARTIDLVIRFDRLEGEASFKRSQRLPEASDLSRRIYERLLHLLADCPAGSIRFVGIGVTDLIDVEMIQLNFFTTDEDESLRRLAKTIDAIQLQHGANAIFRAISISPSGTALEWAHKRGGHFE